MNTALQTFLGDLIAAERHASKSERSEIFERHFPALVFESDPHSDATMSEFAKQKGLAALFEAGSMPVAPEASRRQSTKRFSWIFVGAAIVVFIWAVTQYTGVSRDPAKRIARPNPATKNSPGGVPPAKNPDESPIVKNESDIVRPTKPNKRPPLGGASPDDHIIADKSIGVVREVQGKPLLFAEGSDVGQRIESGTEISKNARIEVGDFGSASIEFDGGSVVKFEPNASAEIIFESDVSSKVAFARRIKLLAGSLYAEVRPTSDGKPFSIETPFAVARVVGTSFGLTVERAASAPVRTVLQVKRGTVEFFNAFGSETATDMTESIAEANKAPTRARRIRKLRDFIVYYGSSHSHIRHETALLDEQSAENRYVYPNGWAGFRVDNKPNGDVRISEIYTDGPAREYGLEIDDVIRTIDGEEVFDKTTVYRAIAFSPGRTLRLRVERGAQKLDISVRTIPRGPPLPPMTEMDAMVLFSATLPAILGNAEESFKALKQLLKGYGIAPVHNNLAVIYETRDDMESAIFHFKEAARLEPQEGFYKLNLAIALQKTGNYARAIEEGKKAVDIDPYHRAAIFFLADAYAFADRYQDAIDVLMGGAERIPRAPRFWMRMSRIHIRAGNFAEAVPTAERAIQLDPQNQLTQLSLATSLVYAERYEEAIGRYQRAIAVSPAQANAFADMAIALEHLGRLDEAETALRAAIERAPRAARFRHQYGQFLSRNNRLVEAESELRAAIRWDPENVLAIADMGRTLLERGQIPEAVAKFREAIKLDPHYAHGHGYLGKLYLRTGDLNAAEPLLREAIRLEPQDASAYVDMGQLFEAKRQIPYAVEWYRRALTIDPNNRPAKQALRRILA